MDGNGLRRGVNCLIGLDKVEFNHHHHRYRFFFVCLGYKIRLGRKLHLYVRFQVEGNSFFEQFY